MTVVPFWKALALEELSEEQWESLCDGCGRCCALKLQNPETGAVHYTRAACRLLDRQTCRCTDYANRAERVPDCTVLNPDRARAYHWLPDSCAYRRLAAGQDLCWWHPLVSGNPDTVHAAGISVRGQVLSEDHVHESDLPRMLVARESGAGDD